MPASRVFKVRDPPSPPPPSPPPFPCLVRTHAARRAAGQGCRANFPSQPLKQRHKIYTCRACGAGGERQEGGGRAWVAARVVTRVSLVAGLFAGSASRSVADADFVPRSAGVAVCGAVAPGEVVQLRGEGRHLECGAAAAEGLRLPAQPSLPRSRPRCACPAHQSGCEPSADRHISHPPVRSLPG